MFFQVLASRSTPWRRPSTLTSCTGPARSWLGSFGRSTAASWPRYRFWRATGSSPSSRPRNTNRTTGVSGRTQTSTVSWPVRRAHRPLKRTKVEQDTRRLFVHRGRSLLITVHVYAIYFYNSLRKATDLRWRSYHNRVKNGMIWSRLRPIRAQKSEMDGKWKWGPRV